MSSTAPAPGGGSANPPSGNTVKTPGSSSSPPPSPPATTPLSPPPTSSPPPPASPSPVSAPPPPTETAPPPPPTAVPPTVKSPPPPSNSSPPPVSTPPPIVSPPPPTNSSPPSSSSPPPPTTSSPPPASSPPPPTNSSPSPASSPPPPTNSSPSPASSPPPISSPPPPTPANLIPPTIQPPSPPSDATPPTAHSPPPPSTPSPSPRQLSPPSASPPNRTLSSPPPSNTTTLKGSPPPPGSPASPTAPSTSPPPPPNSSTVSPPTPTTTSPPTAQNSSTSIVVGAAVAGLVILALCGVLIWYLRKKKRRDGYLGDHYGPPPPGSVSYKSDGMYASVSRTDQYLVKVSPSPSTPGYGSSRTGAVDTPGLGNSSWFTYEELAVATNGFSPQNVLGEGGFGCVYKGNLPDGQVVAVKQLKVGSGQGEREFRAEVEIISRVHHRHLVSLVGYCIADSQRLLVYDYVPNGTLEYHLHGRQRPVMDWATRMRIAVGAARGIAYLHEDCHPRIIHRDIKGSNILLDDRFEAQVSDFGLAKLASDTNTHVTTRVMGTFGYMAPEYASSGKLTVMSDVFSFGVVLLELVTGRKPVDITQPLGDESLVEWARPLLNRALEEGNFEELADPRLENNFDRGEMFRMVEAAAACVRHSAHRRPGMGQVVRALESNAAIADLNNGVKPGESVMYNSAQYSADIRRFQRMAFGSRDNASDFSEVTSDYEINLSAHSNEFRKSKELEAKQTKLWKSELVMPFACGSESPSSGESETRPINRSRFYRDETSEKSSGEAPIPISCKSLTGR